MMLHWRLLPAFHLITRSIICISGGATTRTVAYGVSRGGKLLPSKCSLVGCFRPSAKQSTCYLGSRRKSSSRLCGHPTKREIHGPAIRRSQPPTHLDGVEDAIDSSLSHYERQIQSSNNVRNGSPGSRQITLKQHIADFPPRDRETIGVASNLKRRLQGLSNSGDCRRCWLQKRHCVCTYCVPLEGGHERSKGGIPNVNRLFLLTHHKEICLAVDTAKLILAAFPTTARLVVSGVGREHQPSMGEMLDAASDAADTAPGDKGGGRCLVLFPADDARTFDEIEADVVRGGDATATDDRTAPADAGDAKEGWDVIVIDGTWSQARKMHSKYFPKSGGRLHRVRLSDGAVKALGDAADAPGGNAKGHQLRRHPIKWKEISTLEATRLLLDDMHADGEFAEHSRAMAHYQEIGNDAAKSQLGPPRRG